MTNQWNRQNILSMGGAFQKSRILLSAAELDLFTKLFTQPDTVENIARREGWSERGLRILMDALASQGFLDKTEAGIYTVPENVAELLVSGAKSSILPLIRHRVSMWKTWSNLTEIVKSGGNPVIEAKKNRTREDMEAFIGAMHVIALRMADAIAESFDLSRFTRLLDIGGASGTYTMAFLNKAAQMRATLLDLPEVMEIARKQLTADGFIDRVDLVPGDYTKDEFPEGHDLALLSAIIHINGRDVNRLLYRKIFAALIPGGMIIIRDHVMDKSRTSPPDGAVFAVNMLVATSAGNSYTFDEIKEDLEAAGFTDVQMIRSGKDMDQLVSAMKS